MVTITTTLAKQITQMVLPGKQYGAVTISATVSDNNASVNNVEATLNWNDGTPPVVFSPARTININSTRNLAIGTYFITIAAQNFLQPTPQQTAAYFTVDVQPEQIAPQPSLFLFGPILPMDDGFPNPEQWNFNVGNDLQILKSSVKMLLITNKGERIMVPPYGTNLRRVVFEPNTDSITSLIRQEIDEALNQYEPRVSLDTFTVKRIGPRDVLVNTTFLSKINQASFSLSLPISQ